jgi:hypothetical protein
LLINRGSRFGGEITIPLLQNVVITGNGLPVELPDDMVHILGADSSYTGNTDDKIYINKLLGIVSDQIWEKLDVPYFFKNLSTFYNIDAALTLDPGVNLIFNSATGLSVNATGSLKAIGTASDRIVFTAQNPTPGYWRGLFYQRTSNANNQLDYVTIKYGDDNLTLSGLTSAPVRVSIKNTELKNAGNRGFYFQTLGSVFDNSSIIIIDAFQNIVTTENDKPGSLPDYLIGILDPNNQYTGNVDDRIYIEEVGVFSDITMRKLDIPYYFSDANHMYKVNSPMTIEPGVTLIFSSGSGMNINSTGYLDAVGTANAKIIFTGQQKASAYWKGINYSRSDSPNNKLDYVVVEYGGNGNPSF